jgi:outer membrane PBP1 activator LpoA protein
MKRLFEIIEREYELLKNMLKVAEEQKNALVKYEINAVERATTKLNEIAKELKNYENERINLLVGELKLSRKQAYTMNLTELSKIIDIPETTIKKKEEMRQMIEMFASVNSLNKLLANRALSSIGEILSTLSNPNNSVFNVRI